MRDSLCKFNRTWQFSISYLGYLFIIVNICLMIVDLLQFLHVPSFRNITLQCQTEIGRFHCYCFTG